MTKQKTKQKKWQSLSPYDPTYDPILQASPGHGRDYAPTYWVDTMGTPPADDGPVSGDMDVDVVIIGSGFTGLNCAITLAKDYGIKAHVLDANATAWGCSTRNGGQAISHVGRLSRAQWIDRWGLDVAKQVNREIDEAFEFFAHQIKAYKIDCDAQYNGAYFVAHRERIMDSVRANSELMNNTFGYDTRLLSAEEIREDVVNDHEACGGMYEQNAIMLHPAKLAMGYIKTARKLGAKIHPSSPVIKWDKKDGVHYLTTPNGVVKARRVAVASAAYLSRHIHKNTKDRLFPVLSNCIVSRPLSSSELKEAGIKTTAGLTDSRTLRNYYRLLPDNRLQIGSRSALTGRAAVKDEHLQRLKDAIGRKFPCLNGIAIDYSWWGWVDVSHDMMPRITQPDPAEEMYYAMGYGGTGVMYSAQAGRRMAQMVAGDGGDLDLPIFNTSLKHEGILTPFRRLGQGLLYQWYWLNDER